MCLTGVSSAHELSVDVGLLNRRLVLANDVVFGSVNANRRHYEAGAAALAEADPAWLAPADHPAGAPVAVAGGLPAPAGDVKVVPGVRRRRS